MSQSTQTPRSLVTGGAGFIGSNLVDYLLARGHDVVVVDDESATMNEKFYWNPGAHNHKINILNVTEMRSLFDGIDYVFHLAAESRLQPAILNPIEAVQKNVVGTAVVLQCAREASVKRLIYSSTSSVYGRNNPPNSENQAVDCLNPYSLSKLHGEQLCKLFTDHYGLKCVILRYFNVFGERSPARGQYALVTGIFLDQHRNGRSLTVVGDGSQRRDFVYVQDVCEANFLAATSPIDDAWFGQAFNVAAGKNLAIIDLARLISDDIQFIERRPGEAETTLACIDKIADVIGWRPNTDVEEWLVRSRDRGRLPGPRPV
ncbi:MAG: NAD-dependent epimerase/dehydratase family protein [Mycobacterium sp.]|nr:NAD-dependent epimerase/dehydratase family protein [Mycobacterium sp.]